MEIDEVYIIAGLKGRAGGLGLERAPRKRGWKWPGRGTWETDEGLWNLLQEHLRKHHGVSKVYLPLYVARFEFLHNRRGQSDWGKLMDLLWLGVQAVGLFLPFPRK